MDTLLHSIVSWSVATLRCDPVNVLARVFDVARFAVNTVLCVDLQPLGRAILRVDVLVNTCHAINCQITDRRNVLSKYCLLINQSTDRLTN